MSTVQNLLRDNVRLLEQGRALLAELGEELYVRPTPAAGLSGVGSHVRHCLDFYERFLDALPAPDQTPDQAPDQAEDEPPRLDYDLRRRDERLERYPAAARRRLEELIEALRARVPAVADRSLLVKADAEGTAQEAAPWSRSSVERELQVLLSHTVHHYALIAVALRLHGHAVDEEFGVAPSTLRYWKEQRACAR